MHCYTRTVALAPNIPTSFVPKQPVKAAMPRRGSSGIDTFLFISLIVLVATVAASGALFAYQLYLDGVLESKALRLIEAQGRVDENAIQEFIRARNRFATAGALLDGHVAASQFFDALEERTLQNVRFSSLSFQIADDRSATLSMQGTARTFNALAAQSSELAKEARLRRVIFSDISPQDNGTVSFSLSAEVDAALVLMAAPDKPTLPEAPAVEEPLPAVPASAPAESTVATTTPSAPPAPAGPTAPPGTLTPPTTL